MSRDYLIGEGVITIFTDKGLKNLLEKYHCKSKEELDELLWYDYGVVLIDKRKQEI